MSLCEGLDYYFDPDGLLVLTAKYLRDRGFCCRNGCRHCPYDFKTGKQEFPDGDDSRKV